MSGSVRVYLKGYFQCSPDAFQAQMCDVDISSDTLLSRINEGYTIIGAVAQTSNAVELAATDSQQLQAKIRAIVTETVEAQNSDVDVGELLGDLLADLRILSAM